MELAKDHAPNNSSICLMQSQPYYESEFGEIKEHQKKVFEEGSSSEKSNGAAKNFAVSSSSSLSSPSSINSEGLGYNPVALKHAPEEGHSVISFKAGYGTFANAAGSLLSFDQNERYSQQSFPIIMSNQDDYSIWEDNSHYNYQNQLNSRCSTTNSTNMQTGSSYASTSNGVPFGWLSSEANANATVNDAQELGKQEACLSKRLHTNNLRLQGESTQASKKQCTAVTKTAKPKSKDPQSIAAKNRRERISERLKILQDLVPNGSKVDLVTMLEKAISYVKFLQLQVKVLATDEFWPAQGGKAPDLSQVKEAIDVILASQRDRTSSSK